MSADNLGFIELALVFGAVLAFGAWQLWDVRRPVQPPPAAEPTPPPAVRPTDG